MKTLPCSPARCGVVFALLAAAGFAALAQGAPPPARASRAPAPAASAAATPVEPAARLDQAELDRTPIIGNRELPKVLYIVPWKKPLPGQLAGRPPASVLGEALAPVDRDVFRRELRYDAQATARTPAPSAPASPK